MVRNGFAVDGMFLTPEPARADAAPELTPLQTHVLAQFAHALAVRGVPESLRDADLERLVGTVTEARYRDCVAQGVGDGARALVASSAGR